MDENIKEEEKRLVGRTSLITCITFLSFAVGCFVLFNGRISLAPHHGAVFHEIVYDPQAIVNEILSKAPQQIDTSLFATSEYKDSVTQVKDKAGKTKTVTFPVVIRKKMSAGDTAKIIREIKETRYKLTHLPDSVVKRELISDKLFIDKKVFTLCQLDDKTKVTQGDTIGFTEPVKWLYFMGHSTAPQRFEAQIKMPLKTYDSNIEFLMKYPGFGIWIILILVQFAIYPALILKAVLSIWDFKDDYGQEIPEAGKRKRVVKTFWTAVFSFLAVVVFLLLSLGTFQDAKVVKGSYFLDNIVTVFWVLNIIGYVLAVACFTGFMDIAGFVFCYKKAPATPDFTAENTAVILKLAERIKQLFSTLLTFAAMTLSLTVFTTGALFTALNSMDFIRKVTEDLGYSPLRSDCVYMYGIINTVLLLFFFVPAKLYINSLDRELKDKGIIAANAAAAKPVFPFKDLSGLLIAGSPMLASLLQYLMDLLFN